jgi:hypothetical protein
MHILQTERNIREFLSEAVLTLADCDDVDIAVTTFETAGVTSANEGIVLRAGPPGSPEFQITIVRSR